MAKTSDHQEIRLMRDYLSSLVREMRKTMSTGGPTPHKNMNASGKSKDAFRFDIKTTPGLVIGILYAPDHIIHLERGRGPGKAPPRDTIRKWIDDKGIIPRGGITKDSLAFLIQRKIKEQGTRLHRAHPSGIISETLTQRRVNHFFAEVKELGRLQIRVELKEELHRLGEN